MTCKTNKPH